MSQFNPTAFHPASPNELMLFLDSVITSSLCPHTKDWVCFLYVNAHQKLYNFLKFSMRAVPGNDLFMIKYEERKEEIPFSIDDLITYLQNLPRAENDILPQAAARSAKRIFSGEWEIAADNIVRRVPLPIRIETPNVGPRVEWRSCNPAVWLALKGKYTIADFLAGRSLKLFIEDHWARLSFQFGNDHTAKWEHHDALDRCRCPGYTLPHLLAFAEPSKAADAVLNEIMSHVDPLIVDHLRPFTESFEDERRRASVRSLQNWYQPQASAETWGFIKHFPALAAVSDRLLVAFEDLRTDHRFATMAEAWMQVM